MGDKSNIEWTDATWSPVRARNLVINGQRTGKLGWHCEHASPGCEHCYSETRNRRLGTGLPFKPGHRKDIDIFLDEKMLLAPLRWKRPRMIFVNSMTDTFASFVKDEWLDRMFSVMALASQHTFQVLTKRAVRMQDYINGWNARHTPDGNMQMAKTSWPLPNVWLGVSAEDQQRADERIPLLLETPAAVRFVSLEPLLGPIDLTTIKRIVNPGYFGDCLQWYHQPYCDKDTIVYDHIDWVIIGGESGPGARPMDIEWARSLIAQCCAADVACFMKQVGSRPVMTRRNENNTAQDTAYYQRLVAKDRKGGDPSEWPLELCVREMPV